jgi:hypothetical protein
VASGYSTINESSHICAYTNSCLSGQSFSIECCTCHDNCTDGSHWDDDFCSCW